MMVRVTDSKLDPLNVIFKKCFYEFRESDRESFVDFVVKNYLNYLKCSGAIITVFKEKLIVEEVREEVREILADFLGTHASIGEYVADKKNIAFHRRLSKKRFHELF